MRSYNCRVRWWLNEEKESSGASQRSPVWSWCGFWEGGHQHRCYHFLVAMCGVEVRTRRKTTGKESILQRHRGRVKPVVFLARLSEEGPPYLPRTGITRAAGRSAGLRLGPSSQLLTVREPKFAPVNARIGKGISSFMWVHMTLDATREASSLPTSQG